MTRSFVRTKFLHIRGVCPDTEVSGYHAAVRLRGRLRRTWRSVVTIHDRQPTPAGNGDQTELPLAGQPVAGEFGGLVVRFLDVSDDELFDEAAEAEDLDLDVARDRPQHV
jgi:hypothetical protein